MDRFKRNVRRLRVLTGLSMKEVAARGGIPLRVWQRIESPDDANVEFRTVAKVAVALRVDPHVLFQEPPKQG